MRDLLPPFPFGSDFTETEQRLIPALDLMKSASPLSLMRLGFSGLTAPVDTESLERMGLGQPSNMTDRIYRLLLGGALTQTGKS